MSRHSPIFSLGTKTVLTVLLVALFALPLVSAAAAPREFMNIWKGASCGASSPITTGGPTGPCNLCDAIVVASNIIFNLFVIAIIVSVLMIVAGGIVFMTGGASESKLSLGKSMMTNAVLGLAIALAAWLIVNTLLSFLTGNPTLPWNQISC